MFNQILVVCAGNICRSPMAEALLKQALARDRQSGLMITSAGLAALVGQPPDETVQQLMIKRGIDISSHRGRQINGEMIRQVDLILVMQGSQKKSIEAMEPSARGKIFRLGEWEGFEIPDPYQQGRDVYEEALELIDWGVSLWKSKLLK